MKKLSIALFAMIMAACGSDHGTVSITLPSDYHGETIVVNHIMLDNMFTATSSDDVTIKYDTLQVRNGMAELKIEGAGAARYNVESPAGSRMDAEFYATPGETLKVNIKSFNPLDYSVTGSKLMEDVTKLNATVNPIQQEYIALVQSNDNVTPEQLKEILTRYDDAIKKFVKDNPDSHALPLAITELSGDDFKVIYDNLSTEAKKSILMPFADSFNKDVVDMQTERENENARKAEVASGKIVAPDFTLPDLNGKNVSLSDFKGKWVVLDFWGSWCGWCIKGFPALKDAYKTYGDKIVIIGIDCNDSEEDWRAAVKKYELPWLSLYNGHDREIYTEYNIEGFPTKAIINPEGRLVDLTTGEDPTFFDRLANFVK